MKGIKMITNRRRFELIYVVRGSSYTCTGSGRTRLFACTDRTPVCNVGTRGTRIISSLDSSPGVYTYTSGSYTIDIVQRSYSFRHGATALGWTGVRQQYTLICCHRTLSCVCVVPFSSLTKVLGEGWHIQSLPAFFFPPFFFKMEISSRTLIPYFMPGSVHSGPASLDDCGRIFSDKLRWRAT